jgi:hypothetical protein
MEPLISAIVNNSVPMSVRGFSDGWGIVAHEQVSVKRA